MTLSFYHVPPGNEYYTTMYQKPLCKFCQKHSIPFEESKDLMAVKNSILLVLGQHLTPETIIRIKENGNFLVVFDINDNSVLTGTYGASDEVVLIDLIFKISGIQKTQGSYEVCIDNDLNYTREKKKFQGGNWGKYFEMVAAGKIKSLPYPSWDKRNAGNIPWGERHKLALIRGGHHYYRVHLYLHLLSLGLLDGHSMFPASEYQFQFCKDCKAAFENGGITFEYLRNHPDMSCRLKNWPYDFNTNGGLWNNSCIPRYFDLAELFHKKYGGFNLSAVESAFRGVFAGPGWKNLILNKYLFYGDFKWIFSIYAPPRFWEAAEACTVSLVPERMNDQEFFPPMQEGVHYVTYKEDFSNLREACTITQEKFEYVTNNCFDLYDQWILGKDGYRVSPNLLLHILQEIENAKGVL
jgi:hypothetical protein